MLGEQLVSGSAGGAVAVLGTLLLDLECVGKHASRHFLAHDLLRGTRCKADELVDGGVMLVDGVEQRLGCLVGILSGGDGVLPALGGLERGLRAGRSSQQLLYLLCGVVKQFLVHTLPPYGCDAALRLQVS